MSRRTPISRDSTTAPATGDKNIFRRKLSPVGRTGRILLAFPPNQGRAHEASCSWGGDAAPAGVVRCPLSGRPRRRPRGSCPCREGEHHALRMTQAAERSRLACMPPGIDHELVDRRRQGGEARSRARSSRPARSPARPRSARCRARARAPRSPAPASPCRAPAGKAGEVLGEHRVALVRHRRGALLAGREELLDLAHLGALQVADLGRQPLHRRGDDAERGEEHRVPVARDDLGRDRLRAGGRERGRRAPRRAGRRWRRCRPRRRCRGGDLLARRVQPAAGAGELGIGLRPASGRTWSARRGCRGSGRWSGCPCARARGASARRAARRCRPSADRRRGSVAR
jgi:hypothetical protein